MIEMISPATSHLGAYFNPSLLRQMATGTPSAATQIQHALQVLGGKDVAEREMSHLLGSYSKEEIANFVEANGGIEAIRQKARTQGAAGLTLQAPQGHKWSEIFAKSPRESNALMPTTDEMKHLAKEIPLEDHANSAGSNTAQMIVRFLTGGRNRALTPQEQARFQGISDFASNLNNLEAQLFYRSLRAKRAMQAWNWLATNGQVTPLKNELSKEHLEAFGNETSLIGSLLVSRALQSWAHALRDGLAKSYRQRTSRELPQEVDSILSTPTPQP